jgi:hypothetical protein
MSDFTVLTKSIAFWNRIYYLSLLATVLAGLMALVATIRLNQLRSNLDNLRDKKNEITVNGMPVNKS